MTGFGEAQRQQAPLAVAVEVRTINSKYFKLSVRSGEGYSLLEPQIEAVVRQHIKRGTVQVSLRVNRARQADDYRLNSTALESYRAQVQSLQTKWSIAEPVGVAPLLLLPGVVEEERQDSSKLMEDWPLIEKTLEAALQSMAHMRIEEGRAMRTDLAANCAAMTRELDGIEGRAPLVVEGYRTRLSERLTKIFAEHQVTLEAADIIREVSVYAERSDISEETVRLRSHLEQFATIMDHDESSGRKLEFLTQEMFRETNTIGSKANDVQIAMHVIEIKTAIERIREMIQNVE